MNDESQIQHKKIKVITVNGNNFAVGLDWKALNNARKHMKEAKEYGKKNGLDVVAIKKGDFIQAGFAPKQAKSIKGMYSLGKVRISHQTQKNAYVSD
ncbi:TPA: type 4b pilus protein PilO2 [Citrobacter freundii]|nr:type 4b pilus protein PilO2 [Citrobacter freundii]